jgi:hypothetical protein
VVDRWARLVLPGYLAVEDEPSWKMIEDLRNEEDV